MGAMRGREARLAGLALAGLVKGVAIRPLNFAAHTHTRARVLGSARDSPCSPTRPLAYADRISTRRLPTTARRLLLLYLRDRHVERDGRGDALSHARRQTRHAWVVIAAALQPGRGALRSSPSSSLSPVGVLISRRLFGRRFVRSKRAARLHRDGGRARDARRGWFSPPQSSRVVRARRGGLFFSCSSPIRSPVVANNTPAPPTTFTRLPPRVRRVLSRAQCKPSAARTERDARSGAHPHAHVSARGQKNDDRRAAA